MPPAPKTTVVVPVGSVDDHLHEQLVALQGQVDAGGFEVVLSMNSADAELKRQLASMVEALADERFRIVDSSEQRGASHARNAGAAAARADRLAFCDADDIVEADWLSTITTALDRFDAVGGHLEEERLVPVGQRRWRPPATPGRLPEFQGFPYIVSANMAISRAVFDAVGGFDESLSRCEDIAISLVLQDKGHTIGFVEDAVVHYRHRGGLRSLVRQHYLYGRGMSEVLVRVGLPGRPAGSGSGGIALLKANRSPGQRWSPIVVVRRASTLSGRLVALVAERAHRR